MTQVGSRQYRPMFGAQTMLLRDLNEAWLLQDGTGNYFRFEQLPHLGDTSVFYLKEINDSTGRNPIRFHYDTPVVTVHQGQPIRDLLLDSITYNYHPLMDCPKHMVRLLYDFPTADPQARVNVLRYSIHNGRLRARIKILTSVRVEARAESCTDSLSTLFHYRFSYQPDSDTRRPRLAAVDQLYRADNEKAFPVGRYQYGSATTGGTLRFAWTGSARLPSETPLPNASQKLHSAIASTIGYDGKAHTTRHGLVDFTGDGRLDFLFPHYSGTDNTGIFGDEVWLARNVTDFSGTSFVKQPPRQLLPAQLSLARQTTSERRYDYDDQSDIEDQVNVEETWIAMLDVNGDGRTDIVDADPFHAEPGFWRIYINKPKVCAPDDAACLAEIGTKDRVDPNKVVWATVDLDMTWIRDYLKSTLKYNDIDDKLPISRSRTGRRVRLRYCNGLNGTGDNICAGSHSENPWVVDLSEQQTLVEWKFGPDVNGDSFPDIVANSQPLDRIPLPTVKASCKCDKNVQSPGATVNDVICEEHTSLGFADEASTVHWCEGDPRVDPVETSNELMVFYNRAGVRLARPGPGFSRPVSLRGSGPCAVERWVEDTMSCGFVDVNGDGLIDRYRNDGLTPTRRHRAYLGTGTSFEKPVDLPGSPHRLFRAVDTSLYGILDNHCGRDPSGDYKVIKPNQLIDVTRDGIPDWVTRRNDTRGGEYEVWIGNGTGFDEHLHVLEENLPLGELTIPIEVEGADWPLGYELSLGTEPCPAASTFDDVYRTTAGLFDINGDGSPDLVRATGEPSFDVYEIIGDNGQVGAYDAGRIRAVSNGYGAETQIVYESAKKDTRTSHAVPFPEIVVTQTSTSVGSDYRIEARLSAYGQAALRYHAPAERWVFPGYGRQISMRGKPMNPFRPDYIRGLVQLTERNRTLDYDGGYEGHILVGRVRDIYLADGRYERDPWKLLDYEIKSDSHRLHGRIHIDHAEQHIKGIGGGGNKPDCLAWNPYYFGPHSNYGGSNDPWCRSTGFAYARVVDQWRGAASPQSSEDPAANVHSRREILLVDDYGRPTYIHHQNDVAIPEDDICEAISYAKNDSGHRVFDAVHIRRLNDCEKTVRAGVRFRYDGNPDNPQPGQGLVSLGLTTHRIIERYDGTAGEFLDEHLGDVTSYDEQGNVTAIELPRDDGVTATIAWPDFDPWRLISQTRQTSASDIDTVISTHIEIDPLTLQPVAINDANGATIHIGYDNVGRAVTYSVEGADETEPHLLYAIDYFGYAVGETGGRRIQVRDFHTRVTPAAFSSDPSLGFQSVSTHYFDELGRASRTEVQLGADYLEDQLIVGETMFDSLGRVAFVADTYAASESPDTKYGTSYHYRDDNTLECAVRGRGLQPRTRQGNPRQALFPTCTDVYYAEHRLKVKTYGPNELNPLSTQFAAYDEAEVSAIGRPLVQSRWAAGSPIGRMDIGYDRLGQLKSIHRYQDPKLLADAVEWQFRSDSLGRVLMVEEPGASPRTNRYDSWGNQVATTWHDDGIIHALTTTYDGFGRPLRSVETTKDEDEQEASEARLFFQFAYDRPSGDPNHLSATNLLGRLSHARSPAQAVFFGYDGLGNVQAVSRVGDAGLRHAETYTYRVDGSIQTMAFHLPDSDEPETVRYQFDSAQRISGIFWEDKDGTEPVFAATGVDPLGRYTEVKYGNGVVESRTYNSNDRREPKSYQLTTASGLRLREYLAHDGLLRLSERRDTAGDAPITKRYQYDTTNRLVRVHATQTSTVEHKITYDALGNLLRHDFGGIGIKFESDTSDRDRVCRVIRRLVTLPDPGEDGGLSALGFPSSDLETYGIDSVESGSSSALSGFASIPTDPDHEGLGPSGPTCHYMYDALGNVVRIAEPDLPERIFTYDGASRILTIERGPASARFEYDPFGQVATINVTGTGISGDRQDRRYGGLIEEANFTEDNITLFSAIERRVLGPMGVFFMRRGAGPNARKLYVHGDDKSNRFTTNREGDIVQETTFGPFGTILSSLTPALGNADVNKYLWDRGDALNAFGVYHLGARIYDRESGRFLQRDPIVIARSASEAHPYAYAWNDPVNFADPTGFDPIVTIHGCLGDECKGPTGSGGSGFPPDRDYPLYPCEYVDCTQPEVPSGTLPGTPSLPELDLGAGQFGQMVAEIYGFESFEAFAAFDPPERHWALDWYLTLQQYNPAWQAAKESYVWARALATRDGQQLGALAVAKGEEVALMLALGAAGKTLGRSRALQRLIGYALDSRLATSIRGALIPNHLVPQGVSTLRSTGWVAKSREAFMRRALATIKRQPNHPLRFLVDPNTGKWRARSHLSTKPTVQAGHMTSRHSGAPERFALEDSFFNQVSNWRGETQGAIFRKPAVEIGGVPVDARTAEVWRRLGCLLGEC
jgi:RHS repeat-associated protein